MLRLKGEVVWLNSMINFVIGAGPGGMITLYASRANLSVLMLDCGIYGGQMNNTAAIENYPGFSSVGRPDLAEDMYKVPLSLVPSTLMVA